MRTGPRHPAPPRGEQPARLAERVATWSPCHSNTGPRLVREGDGELGLAVGRQRPSSRASRAASRRLRATARAARPRRAGRRRRWRGADGGRRATGPPRRPRARPTPPRAPRRRHARRPTALPPRCRAHARAAAASDFPPPGAPGRIRRAQPPRASPAPGRPPRRAARARRRRAAINVEPGAARRPPRRRAPRPPPARAAASRSSPPIRAGVTVAKAPPTTAARASSPVSASTPNPSRVRSAPSAAAASGRRGRSARAARAAAPARGPRAYGRRRDAPSNGHRDRVDGEVAPQRGPLDSPGRTSGSAPGRGTSRRGSRGREAAAGLHRRGPEAVVAHREAADRLPQAPRRLHRDDQLRRAHAPAAGPARRRRPCAGRRPGRRPGAPPGRERTQLREVGGRPSSDHLPSAAMSPRRPGRLWWLVAGAVVRCSWPGPPQPSSYELLGAATSRIPTSRSTTRRRVSRSHRIPSRPPRRTRGSPPSSGRRWFIWPVYGYRSRARTTCRRSARCDPRSARLDVPAAPCSSSPPSSTGARCTCSTNDGALYAISRQDGQATWSASSARSPPPRLRRRRPRLRDAAGALQGLGGAPARGARRRRRPHVWSRPAAEPLGVLAAAATRGGLLRHRERDGLRAARHRPHDGWTYEGERRRQGRARVRQRQPVLRRLRRARYAIRARDGKRSGRKGDRHRASASAAALLLVAGRRLRPRLPRQHRRPGLLVLRADGSSPGAQHRRLRLRLAGGAPTPGARPTVYIGSYDGTFYALDARTAVCAGASPGAKISGSATIVGDLVYFSDLGPQDTCGLSADRRHVWKTRPTARSTPRLRRRGAIYLNGYSPPPRRWTGERRAPRPRSRARQTPLRGPTAAAARCA